MAVFDNLNLNAFARYDEGLPLPDEMTLGEIAIFWATPPCGPRKTPSHDDGARRRVKIMLEAFKSGRLVGVDVAAKEASEIAADESRGQIGMIPFEDSNRLRIMREVNRHIQIKKSDFISWLESENQPLPSNCQLEKWWGKGGGDLAFSINQNEEYLLMRRAARLKETEKFQKRVASDRLLEKSKLELLALNKLLPEFLTLRQIALLSGHPPLAFEDVMEQTGLKIQELKIEDSGCRDGFYIEKGLSKSTYKNHLKNVNQWPVDGLLANWWTEEQIKTPCLIPDNHDDKNIPVRERKTETKGAEFSALTDQIDIIAKAILLNNPNATTTEAKAAPEMQPYLRFAARNRDYDHLTHHLERLGFVPGRRGKSLKRQK